MCALNHTHTITHTLKLVVAFERRNPVNDSHAVAGEEREGGGGEMERVAKPVAPAAGGDGRAVHTD